MDRIATLPAGFDLLGPKFEDLPPLWQQLLTLAKGYLHRYIKPENFLRSTGKWETIVSITEFELSGHWRGSHNQIIFHKPAASPRISLVALRQHQEIMHIKMTIPFLSSTCNDQTYKPRRLITILRQSFWKKTTLLLADQLRRFETFHSNLILNIFHLAPCGSPVNQRLWAGPLSQTLVSALTCLIVGADPPYYGILEESGELASLFVIPPTGISMTVTNLPQSLCHLVLPDSPTTTNLSILSFTTPVLMTKVDRAWWLLGFTRHPPFTIPLTLREITSLSLCIAAPQFSHCFVGPLHP
jgi:hypothetical protein